MSIFKELKRRNVFRVAAAYIVVAWVLIQVGATLEPALYLPDWVDSLLAFFLILGFPVAVFFAWAYELTPEGLKRDTGLRPEDASRVLAGHKWDRVIIVLLVIALAWFALDKYAVDITSRQEAGQVAAQPVEAVTTAPLKSIAVLPFVNMSSDPEQAYFSDGLTEELLNLLAGIAELKVAARTSVFYYKDKLEEVPLPEIARQLEVAHVLEGSVRKSGDTVRVTAQLIKVDDGFHLWSATFDRELDDVFAIQDEIAAAVVDQLKLTLLGEAPRAKVIDTESYQLALQARFLFNRRAPGDLQRALELFQQAVALDPDNTVAWAGLTPLYLWLYDPPEIVKARAAVDRALELEPDNPEALARLSMLLWTEGKTEEGSILFDKTLREHPSNPLLLGMKAGIRFEQGDLQAAIEYQRRALDADPLHISNLSNQALYLSMAGQVEEAELFAMKAMELSPDTQSGKLTLAKIRLLQGRISEAQALVESIRVSGISWAQEAFDRQEQLLLESAIAYSLGDEEKVYTTLEAFQSQYAQDYPVGMAYLFAWRGENDAAFNWLDQALSDNPDLEVFWLLDSWLWRVHGDPRWAELMQRWPDYREIELPPSFGIPPAEPAAAEG